MIIWLIGFMASGKSTLGKKVARKLDWDFVDIDELIEEKTCLSIGEIFDRFGEKWFREREQEAVHFMDTVPGQNLIVSAGGGTPCFYDNIKKMKSKGTVIYLKLNAGRLAARLKAAKERRPLIERLGDGLEEYVGGMLDHREPFYLQADHLLEDDEVNVKRLVELVQKIESSSDQEG